MGIREEIEKLLIEYDYPDCLYRVLSILDEWECVEETEIDFEGEIGLVRWDAENYCHLVYRFRGNPGDHIIIYRRKKR